MKKCVVLFCGMAAAGLADAGSLTLEQALELARKNSPELRAARAEMQAAGQEIRAAGRWTNPELGFEAEGVGGDNDGFDLGEYTLAMGQEFPTSGRIGKGLAVAQHGQRAAEYAVDQTGLEFEVAVRVAFIEVLAQQEVSRIRGEQEELAQKFSTAAKSRHEAGGASELEILQADVQLEKARLETYANEKQIEAARVALAAILGVASHDLGTPTGDFFRPLAPPVATTVAASHPALERFQSLEAQVRAEARLARSQGIPDVTLGAGIRYEADGEIQSYVLGASMPLPFFTTGRPESAAAALRADAVIAERELVLRELQQELAETLVEYELATGAVERYQKELLPKAMRLYELSRTGYASGHYSSLDLVVAQQNLAETNIHYIETLRDAQLAQAQLTQFISE